MKKPDRAVYFDLQAGVVRRVPPDRESHRSPRDRRPPMHHWDHRSPLSWQEFIDRWERRFAAG